MTIQELANKLGLSVGTISGAINNNPAISSTTRERVLEAATRYGYRPNKAARALIKNDSITIGILFGHDEYTIATPFYAKIIAGASASLSEMGRDCSILSIPVRGLLNRKAGPIPAVEHERALNQISSAVQGGLFRKVIILGNIEQEHLDVLREMNADIVYAGNYPLPSWVSNVSLDLPEATRLIVAEIAAGGYRRLLHLGKQNAPRQSVQFGLVRGLREACETAGLHFELFEEYDHPVQMLQMAADVPPDTAVVPGNEAIAVKATCALLMQGRSIPEEIGVASFGNTALSTSVLPELTTVDLRFDELGRRAAQVVAGDLGAGRSESIPAALVRRGSLRLPG